MAAREALLQGRPTVLLWRETPTFGHFILLHVRNPRGKVDVELFDPFGTNSREESWKHYMDDPTGLNDGGLRPLLQELMDIGCSLSYNPPSAGPQKPDTFSCGLWCLLRAAFPTPSPTEFFRLCA